MKQQRKNLEKTGLSDSAFSMSHITSYAAAMRESSAVFSSKEQMQRDVRRIAIKRRNQSVSPVSRMPSTDLRSEQSIIIELALLKIQSLSAILTCLTRTRIPRKQLVSQNFMTFNAGNIQNSIRQYEADHANLSSGRTHEAQAVPDLKTFVAAFFQKIG